jgi:hypothetical protein
MLSLQLHDQRKSKIGEFKLTASQPIDVRYKKQLVCFVRTPFEIDCSIFFRIFTNLSMDLFYVITVSRMYIGSYRQCQHQAWFMSSVCLHNSAAGSSCYLGRILLIVRCSLNSLDNCSFTNKRPIFITEKLTFSRK